MEFIVCILLDKTFCIAFYKVLLSTESFNDVGFSCTLSTFIFFILYFLFFIFIYFFFSGDACMYLCTFYPTLILSGCTMLHLEISFSLV